MSILPILTWPDPRLSQVCETVTDPQALTHLVRDLFDTMYAAPGRGLAAPQVGSMLRVFVMDPTWKEGTKTPFVCINPEILGVSDTTAEALEACLSIPDVSENVTRPTEITLAYTDGTGVRRKEHLTGFAATCAQHELDHLNGIVIFDRVPPDRRASVRADYMAQL